MKTKNAMIWVILTLMIGGMSRLSPAQGTLNFLNTSATKVNLNYLGWADLGPMPGIAGQFYFQLFIAPSGTMNPNDFVPTEVRGTNVAAAGRFSGGSNRVVPGVLPGSTRAILVRGWSVSLGEDYYTALMNWNFGWGGLSGFLGESSIAPSFIFGGFDGTVTLPNYAPFGGLAGVQITSGFSLIGVPEPTTATLFCVGISILVLRRSKQTVNVRI